MLLQGEDTNPRSDIPEYLFTRTCVGWLHSFIKTFYVARTVTLVGFIILQASDIIWLIEWTLFNAGKNFYQCFIVRNVY